ncbi:MULTISPECIES: hypothetical protein [unclassified Caballeronia]|uniref:hypothetical protein n=1 Tax=unclassified Caballeronia TaxID=2646786 RepID=UPI00202997C9|nr:MULTISPECIES: hypothetical protein [unclassified Caballeronia]
MKVRQYQWNRLMMTVAMVLPFNAVANETIHVALGDDSIRLDTDRARAGRVSFEVTNVARSGTVHEFVVLSTNIDESRLPVRNGQVVEGQLKKMGEVENVHNASSKRLSLNLRPGRYVLICNMPGHYAMGMHKTLTVLPSSGHDAQAHEASNEVK